MDNFSQNRSGMYEDLQDRAARLTQEQAAQEKSEDSEFKLSVPDNLPTQETAATTEIDPGQKIKEWHAGLTQQQKREITLELLGMNAKESSEVGLTTQKEAVAEKASQVESGSAALNILTSLNDNRLGGREGFMPESKAEPVIKEDAPTLEVPVSEAATPEAPTVVAAETPAAPVVQEVKESNPGLIIEGEPGDTPRDLVDKLLKEVVVNERFPDIKDFNEEDKDLLNILLGKEVVQRESGLDDNQLSYAA